MRDYSVLTDEQVVALAQEKDGGAVEYLMLKYKGLVKLKARPFFIAGAEGEDLVQEGMIGLYKAIRDYSPDKNVQFRAFAILCVRRQMITALKTAARLKHSPLNSYISLNKAIYDEESERTLLDIIDATGNGNPEDVFISNEDMTGMRSQLDSLLSKLELEVLEYYLRGKTYQEIAVETRRETKSVDNALQRVKRKLEGLMKERA